MKFFVYIVECKDKSLYTGITWNLRKRIKEHNLRVKTCLQKAKFQLDWYTGRDLIAEVRQLKKKRRLRAGRERKNKR